MARSLLCNGLLLYSAIISFCSSPASGAAGLFVASAVAPAPLSWRLSISSLRFILIFATSFTSSCSFTLSISLHFFMYSLRRISLGITAMLFTISPMRLARATGSSPTSLSKRLVLKRMKSTLLRLIYSSTSSVLWLCA